jgi:uncharacterized protein with predicted RNA binding PUA domain
VGLGDALRRIRGVADYQFGKGVGVKLFPEKVEIVFSKRTGRIRYVYLDGERLATLRPTNGFLSLSITGAKRIVENMDCVMYLVNVKDGVAQFIAKGGDVFAKHVIEAQRAIRPRDEVIVVDGNGEVLAVGRAVLSGEEMKAFKHGVAVKVRRGRMEES